MDTILEAIILPLAIAVFAALAVWFITGSTVTAQVSCGLIPDVRGRRIGDAIAALRQAGLRPRVEYVENGANESEDIVLDQWLYPADPESPGARITITTKESLPPPSYFEIVFPTSSGLGVLEKYVVEGTLPPEIAAQLTTNSTLRIVVIIHPYESPDEFWVQDAQVTIEDHLWAAYPVYFGTHADRGLGKRFEVHAIIVRTPVNQCLLNLREFEELIEEADVKAPSIEVERSY